MGDSVEILSVVGARPQFIKAAPVSAALGEAGIKEFLVHTGQHYDHRMSEVFFSELNMAPPSLNLQVGSGSHADQTAAMLVGLERAIQDQKPDMVMVYGDTNSTLAGALAAAKLNVPVAHVEAGLRSYNRSMPEEINRIVADSISDLLLVPTEAARRNLVGEGVPESQIVMTGDVMFDAAVNFKQLASEKSTVLVDLELVGEPFVLTTIHRAENTDVADRMFAIIDGLKKVAEEMRVIFPMHPRTKGRCADYGITDFGSVEVIEPVGFLDMIWLEANANVVATDSGGVQKEAFFHSVPCVTVREETEWGELVDAGWNRLVTPDTGSAVADAVLDARGSRGRAIEPYGQGDASHRIAEALCCWRS